MQIVFLFDLNAFSGNLLKSTELQRKLLCLRLACLRILTHYSAIVPNLKWGFKFFDSRGSCTQIMYNFSFPNVSLESFEILENEICIKYQRHVSILEALAVSTHCTDSPLNEKNISCNKNNKSSTPVQLLHLALTQILYEYQWNDYMDMFSPSTRKRVHKNTQKRNILFLISKCASNDPEFKEYFGTEYSTMKVSTFSKLFLPQSLHEQLIEKASIFWIWLNTSENESFLEHSKPGSLTMIANALKFMKCALIPLCLLSELNYILKIQKKHKERQSESLQNGGLHNSLVPFSSLFLQSVLYPFYLNSQAPADKAEICFVENAVKIPITITKVPLQWIGKGNNSMYEESMSQRERKLTVNKIDNDLKTSMVWSTFTVHFAVQRHVQVKASDMLLCLPRMSDELPDYNNLRNLTKSMVSKNISLFIVCESACGLTMPAVFTPLSDSSATISIVNPEVCFIDRTIFSNSITESSNPFDFSEVKKKLAKEVQNFPLNNKMNPSEEIKENFDSQLKPFQMECMETWFQPNSTFSNVLCEIQQHKTCDPEIETFHEKLRLLYLHRKRLQTEPVEMIQNELQISTVCSETNNQEEMEETYKDLSYDQLISLLTETYDSALKFNGDVLHSAKKIIKVASSFFLKKSIISYEENMKNFMAEYFSLTSQKVIAKYKADEDADAGIRKINECQLQSLLALEMEVLFPSSEGSSCADNVRSFLGVLSFNSSSSEHNKFLCEVLKENYIHNLYDILVEIGDELMFPDEDSPFNPFEDHSSGSVADLFSSVVSSTLSQKSSSSTSSRGDSRKLIRKRSDILDTNKSRQVLLPGKSPRKKKNKGNCSGAERKAIRCSPRLASKRKREKFKTVDSKTESVRRNLFKQDRKLQTPRSSRTITPRKKKSHTPKAHHVLKTSFVPETPSYKQNQSALQRRKSQMDITGASLEIEESPAISKNPKGDIYLNSLKKMKSTPESNRRLSLKLFSKEVLSSPTARMGLKKCSKRLFDQVSSQVYSSPFKKIKLADELEDASVE